MVVLSTLVFTGCNKNEDPADEALKQGEAILARIMNFKQQVDYYKTNPDVKDGESVTLDEAIWNIEALFNLTYAYPELSYGRTETADTVLYLPVGSDNTVLLTDLTVFYGQMYEVVRNIYQGIELDNKQFLILDVEAGDLHGSQQAIKLHSIQGSVKGTPSTPPTPPQNGPFPPGILWWYGENGGNTQDDGNQNDAAHALAEMLDYWLVPKAPANYEYIYTHTVTKSTELGIHHMYPYSGFPEIEPRYCEFYIENPTIDNYWLDSYRMNYHYFAERYLVLEDLPNDDQQPIVPAGHVLFEIHIKDGFGIIQNYESVIYHITEACYGRRDIVGHNIVNKENLD
jgi:hypothetical protein